MLSTVTRSFISGSSSHAKMRVAIIGSGVAGPVLAMLLKEQLGCTPTVFEAADAIREVGAGISLAPNGLKVLHSLGFKPSLAQKLAHEVGEALPITQVLRPDNSIITSFDTRAEQKHGFPMVGLRRFRLINTLLESMQQMDIPLQLNKRIASIGGLPPVINSSGPSGTAAQQGPVELRFTDGSSFEADLVVGCDGLRSRTRAIIQGDTELSPSYTGKEVIFAVTRERNQDLVPRGTITMLFGRPHNDKHGGQHFGSYGLGPDACWFVSLSRPSEADAGSSKTTDSWGPVSGGDAVDAVRAEVRDRFKGWLAVQDILDREVAAMIRVGIFERDPTRGWVRGPVTLAGDAACSMPPNLGQGGNKAIENCGVLAQCLARHRANIGLALSHYERLSSRRAADLLAYSRQAALTSDLTNPVAITARNALVRTVVALNGTLPSDWMWQYDCNSVVDADAN